MGKGEVNIDIPTDASPVYHVVNMTFVMIGAAITGSICTVLAFVYGILMLIPSDPFTHREISKGVMLIVFACSGMIGMFSGCVGGCLTGIVCTPVACCCAACFDNC